VDMLYRGSKREGLVSRYIIDSEDPLLNRWRRDKCRVRCALWMIHAILRSEKSAVSNGSLNKKSNRGI